MKITLPAGLGHLDFGEWIYGILAAFIAGGSAAATSSVVMTSVDPEHFNIHTAAFFELAGSLFLANGAVGALMFLRQKPLPEIRTVTTTVERTSIKGIPEIVVSKTEETRVESIEGPPARKGS